MYAAKQSGRDCTEVFNAVMAARSRQKLSRKDELRYALARNEFVLHFQPQQDRRSGKVVGAEALIRWNHPTEGLIFPGDFIPLAEETGLIVQIGEWVAREACRIGKRWQVQGLAPIRVSINVSARQFQEANLVKTISAAIADSGFDAAWLELEVTESLIMKDLNGSIAKMKELTSLGLSLSVDDFGTGYSSLSVLKKFPLSRLKIDRSFIADIPNDPDDMAITSAIISLAQKLGLHVIAEGVETEEQAQFLIDSGCTEIQGYLYSRPVAEPDLAALLQANLSAVGKPAKAG
jgi:EAL domain-containing protein (putative c-di-GMP-specific phosphodiesterase class I)